MEALTILSGAYAQVRDELDRVAADLRSRENSLVEALEACRVEHRIIEQRRLGLYELEKSTQELFKADPITTPSDLKDEVNASEEVAGGQSKLKARIGDQRYLLFAFLETHYVDGSYFDLASLVYATGLTPKRVKDQMVADVRLATIEEKRGGYRLTAKGIDLLERFKIYKQERGQPLPSKETALNDEPVGYEVEVEETSEEAESTGETTNEADEYYNRDETESYKLTG